MSDSLKKMSMTSRGLKYKLIIAFCLMSVIPILVLGYIVSVYIFPSIEPLAEIHILSPQKTMQTLSIIILLVLVTSMLGFYIAKLAIDRVIFAAVEARLIAGGQFERRIPLDKRITEEDEIGDLAKSVNTMAEMIRTDLEEFKVYSQKTQKINVEIRKNLLALSGLLQVADVISSSSMEAKDVMEIILERVTQLVDTSYAVLYLRGEGVNSFHPKLFHNLEGERLREVVVTMNEGPLGRAFFSKTLLIVDDAVDDAAVKEFKNANGLDNLVGVPIYSRKRPLGILVVGNRLKEYRFQKDELEFYKVFSKQIAIVMENEILIKKVKKLAMRDDLTGLFTESYILGILEDEIKRSIFFQRPCSFDVFNIDDFKAFRDTYGDLMAEEVLRRIAQIVKTKAGPVGKAARIGGDGFALLLLEKNKREATRVADELRKEIAATDFVGDKSYIITISGGIGENPLDGSTAEAVFRKAVSSLTEAKAQGKNRIIA